MTTNLNQVLKRFTITFFTGFMYLCITGNTIGQGVYYSEINREETKQSNFDILGKFSNNILIFKNLKNKNYISVYNPEMSLVENVDLSFIPPRLIEYDILTFPEHSYIFYQYQQRNVAYLMVVKIGPDGHPITSPIELDTTHINYNASRRVYSVISSEDKTKFMAFRINTRDERKFVFDTQLYSPALEAMGASHLELQMNDEFDFLTDFFLDNEGTLVFGKGRRKTAQENISNFWLITKPKNSDKFELTELAFQTITLDEVKLRVDNKNNRYLFTAFYYKNRRDGAIEGVANAMYDKSGKDWTIKNIIPFNEELRADAAIENNLKNAFNDYFIQQIFILKDGGFIMNAEAVYQSTRGTVPFNRWDMMGGGMGGMMGGGMGGMMGGSLGGWGNPYNGNGMWGGNSTRFHADNVIVLIFDKDGQLEISNVIRKKQFDDQSEAMVGYQTINTGNVIHFLYNSYDKREINLAYQSIDSDGKVTRNPNMRALDPKYSFLPKYSRQVGARTVIIPAILKSNLVFARIDF